MKVESGQFGYPLLTMFFRLELVEEKGFEFGLIKPAHSSVPTEQYPVSGWIR